MPQPERFETLVLGSGNGGMYLAWHMARSGRRTAVVERRWIGGSCPNINCLPSKNEIWSAKSPTWCITPQVSVQKLVLSGSTWHPDGPDACLSLRLSVWDAGPATRDPLTRADRRPCLLGARGVEQYRRAAGVADPGHLKPCILHSRRRVG
jgi:cation diffusion facilitator CzcD-associated flavoprotein CzcO